MLYEVITRLFSCQTPRDLAVAPLEMKDELEGRNFTKASRTYFVPSERFSSVTKLIGPHNKVV